MTTLKIPGGVLERGVACGDDWIAVPRKRIRQVLEYLKGQGYASYCFMTAVDHLAEPGRVREGDRFELVYQLRNMETRHELRVRVGVPEGDPRVPSAHDLFKPANWDERETWDLFGIEFEGHPELTRILLPDEWLGHPLRRDYPVGGEPVDFSEDHRLWRTSPTEA